VVWAQAAAFFAARIQGPGVVCPSPHESRKSDMSAAAAKALKTVLGNMEAACLLSSNRETVVRDITNPAPQSQSNLKRVDASQRASVDTMLKAVANRLRGKSVEAPSNPEAARAWADAAAFLSGRIQSSSGECSGRAADMSANAATSMRAVLAQIEASSKLIANRQTVVADITNTGSSGVGGGRLSQQHLKRVQGSKGSVDAMIKELSNRLLGNKKSEPKSAEEAQVWAEAAIFFNSRIQASAGDCPGRAADMTSGAAAAMRTALSHITNQTKMSSAAGSALRTVFG